MGRKVLLVALAVVALVVVPAQPGQADKRPAKPNELMKRKLEQSQKVLEGLAVNDFDLVSKHAGELLLISKQAEWRVLKTTEYELFSNSFQRSAGDLIKHAKDKNLDAAALAYVDLTLTCVKCHKHVREERKVILEEPIR
jgi:hypothetical protein